MTRRHPFPEVVILLAGAGALCALAIAVMGDDFLMAWTGDAVIHLRVAELLAGGYGFQFNLGEPVVATTSLLWTFLLASLFRLLTPDGVAHAVKLLSLALWVATICVTCVTWGQLARSRPVGWASAAVLALNPGVFQNSTNGMEAILLALLQIALFFVVFERGEARPRTRLPLALILAALAALARPEGILFCLLLVGFLAWRRRSLAGFGVMVLAGAALGAAVTAGINLHVGGHWMPDSGVARMAAGLRESLLLGPIHVHPRSILRMLAYLPLTIGVVLAALAVTGRAPLLTGAPTLRSALSFSVLVVAAMLFFYTFVFGATHTIRYWIPFFPFIAGASCTALISLYQSARRRAPDSAEESWLHLPRWTVSAAGVAAIVWMTSIYAIEWRQRVQEGVGYPHAWIANAVANRSAYTAAFLRQSGVAGLARPIRLAVTEVQSRYFLEDDGSVEILSLDGRVAPGFARYVDAQTGLRRFDLFLDELKPDLIALEQLHPAEPVLPRVLQALLEGQSGVIAVDGYRFLPVDDFAVKYLHAP